VPLLLGTRFVSMTPNDTPKNSREKGIKRKKVGTKDSIACKQNGIAPWPLSYENMKPMKHMDRRCITPKVRLYIGPELVAASLDYLRFISFWNMTGDTHSYVLSSELKGN